MMSIENNLFDHYNHKNVYSAFSYSG
jgi:hypothetical protein